MKRLKKFLFGIFLLSLQQSLYAQTGNWAKAGNSLSGTEKLGSTNGQPVRFFSKNLQRMTLDTGGKLGIGITKPLGRLHVLNGKSGAALSANPNLTLVLENSTDNLISMLAPSTKVSGLAFGNETSTREGGIFYNAFAQKGMQFFTNDNQKMVITATGEVGVGVSVPRAKLHVASGFSGATPVPSTMILETDGTNFINLTNPATFASGILFGNPVHTVEGSIVYNASASHSLQFNMGSNQTRMVITGNGKVGIGTITPGAELHIFHENNTDNGGFLLQNKGLNHAAWRLFVNNDDRNLQFFSKSGNVASIDDVSGAYFTLSDMRMKKDIENAPDVLDNVMQLAVKKYHFLSNGATDKKNFGMLAQDVEKLFPEIVSHNNNYGQDQYAVNYSAYGVIAIKAIQEQQRKIETLEERISKLKAALQNPTSKNNSFNRSPSAQAGQTLSQNQPNPFSEHTIIHYTLPRNTLGQIKIYNLTGALLKMVPASGNHTTIDGADLKAGTYTYSLIANGKVLASKKMIVVK